MSEDRAVEDRIVQADRRFRRRVFWWVGVALLLGLLGLLLVRRHVDGILELADRDLDQAIAQARRLAAVCAWITGLGLTGIGLWFGRLGWQIYLWDQYPPPRWRVIKDTRVRRGDQARRLARLALACCAISILGGAASGWLLYRLAAGVLK
ncbi:MAG TPA: hypothetical protein EYP56_13120 [Planctomycetaceae bacterium]|nr:hypothetical protein [Planctomycetaceae bacterium]HIQ22137.1 hypothetical protein [Planctomycetota bacterium]